VDDILEDIVAIFRRHDVVVAGVAASRRAVVVDGSVRSRDLNRAMRLDLHDEEATTVAGW